MGFYSEDKINYPGLVIPHSDHTLVRCSVQATVKVLNGYNGQSIWRHNRNSEPREYQLKKIIGNLFKSFARIIMHKEL